MSKIPFRKTVVINQAMSTASNFVVDLNNHQISFTPKEMIIRQLIYSNTATGIDTGTYLIWCSTPGANIAAVYVGIQASPSMPETVIPIVQYQPSLNFNVTRADPSFNNPTGVLTMVIELIGNGTNEG